MATDQFATGKSKLIEPGHGNYPDQWDQPNNANFGSIDALVSGTTTINASAFDTTTKTVTLTFDPYNAANNQQPWTGKLAGQNLRILINGGLAFDAVLLIPAKVPGFWFIDNQTTGSFTLTVKTTSATSTGVVVPQSNCLIVYSDGTNVIKADSGIVDNEYLVPAGAIQAYAGTTVPSGWLLCDGTNYLRSQYPKLFAAIGTTWGAGNGSTTFAIPDLKDMFLRGSGSSAVGVYEADTYLNHTHPVTDPGHKHIKADNGQAFVTFDPASAGPIGGAGNSRNYTDGTSSATTGITIGDSTTGGTETRPKNKRVLYIIKT